MFSCYEIVAVKIVQILLRCLLASLPRPILSRTRHQEVTYATCGKLRWQITLEILGGGNVRKMGRKEREKLIGEEEEEGSEGDEKVKVI